MNQILPATRGINIDDLQRFRVECYGAGFDLITLKIPWQPEEIHWSPMRREKLPENMRMSSPPPSNTDSAKTSRCFSYSEPNMPSLFISPSFYTESLPSLSSDTTAESSSLLTPWIAPIAPDLSEDLTLQEWCCKLCGYLNLTDEPCPGCEMQTFDFQHEEAEKLYFNFD